MAAPPPRKPAFNKPQAAEKPATPPPDAGLAHLPPRRPGPAASAGREAPKAAPAAEAAANPAQATASGRYEIIAAIDGAGDCGIASPIVLSSLLGGAVAVSPAATLSIEIFASLEAWMAGVQGLAVKHLGQEVAEVRNAADYVCRGRNNRKGARISQHAFGRAFDIYGFRLKDGSEVTLTGDWGGKSAKGQFLKEVEALNCKLFKTALGPKADKHHRDHFHIDLGPETRKSHYCR